jgi:hypothetical protein
MTSIVRKVWLTGAACVVAAPLWAADGILIVQKVTTAAGTTTTHQIQIEPHRMRMDTGGAVASAQTMIFDGTKQVMYMVNDADKSYREVSKADVDAVSDQMSAAMARVPPEMRAQIQQAMRGRVGAPGSAAKVQYKKTGTGTVGKWSCDKYEGSSNGQKTIEICTVDPKVLGFGLQDFGVTKDFAEFFQKLMPSNALQAFTVGTGDAQGYSGVPVQSIVTINGQTITSELTDAKRQSFADSLFQPPAGYTKQDMSFGRGRRGGGQ